MFLKLNYFSKNELVKKRFIFRGGVEKNPEQKDFKAELERKLASLSNQFDSADSINKLKEVDPRIALDVLRLLEQRKTLATEISGNPKFKKFLENPHQKRMFQSCTHPLKLEHVFYESVEVDDVFQQMDGDHVTIDHTLDLRAHGDLLTEENSNGSLLVRDVRDNLKDFMGELTLMKNNYSSIKKQLEHHMIDKTNLPTLVQPEIEQVLSHQVTSYDANQWLKYNRERNELIQQLIGTHVPLVTITSPPELTEFVPPTFEVKGQRAFFDLKMATTYRNVGNYHMSEIRQILNELKIMKRINDKDAETRKSRAIEAQIDKL